MSIEEKFSYLGANQKKLVVFNGNCIQIKVDGFANMTSALTGTMMFTISKNKFTFKCHFVTRGKCFKAEQFVFQCGAIFQKTTLHCLQ